jgi:pre-mRNA-splicing factor CWC26
VIEVNIEDEEIQAYAMKMTRARERNAQRWREVTIDGQVVVKVEEDQGPDLSPPRADRREASPDLSPPRGRAGDDLSPPRGRAGGDLSPPRSRGGPRQEQDLSPPRTRVKKEPGVEEDEDLSPPRGRKRGSEPGDLSPKRKVAEGDLEAPRDLSPVRKKPRQMSGGGRAGLFLGEEVARAEEEEKRRAKEALKKLDPKSSGQGAATVYRDRRGKVLSGLTQMIAQEEGMWRA